MSIYHELTRLGIFDNITTAAGYRFVFRKTLDSLPQGGTVLDWGCGDGRFTYFLLRNGMRVTAYSIVDNLKIGTELRTQWPAQFTYVLHKDPRTLPFAAETFDAVFSIGVLEHVRETGGDELASLAELKRVLKPNGKLFCFHLPRKWSWIENLIRVLRLRRHRHQYLYSRRDVVQLLDGSGFQLIDMGRYSALPRLILSALPNFMKNSGWFCTAYNFADGMLAAALPFLTQNIFFIASKR